VIVLDYDGTLVPFADRPDGAKADDNLRALLQSLSSDQRNVVVILSGRDRHSLNEWLGDLGITLVAEHGGWVRMSGTAEWTRTLHANAETWKRHIRPILELTVERIPASFIEEKEFSLVWHYRKSNMQSGTVAARELMNTLSMYAINLGVQVMPGNRTVEVTWQRATIGRTKTCSPRFRPVHTHSKWGCVRRGRTSMCGRQTTYDRC
jgi:trehalose 6-phosphate synthase/phosphatase